LFGKSDERPSAAGAGVQGVANILLIVLVLVITVFRGGMGGNTTSDLNDKSLGERCVKEIAEIHTIIDRFGPMIDEPKSSPPVHVTMQANPAFAPPTPTELKFPSKIDITVSTQSPPPPHPTPDCACGGGGESSEEAKKTAEGAIKAAEQPSKPGPKGDDYVIFPPKTAKTPLVLHKDVACTYEAELVLWGGWPQDPVEIKISKPDPKNDKNSCPDMGEDPLSSRIIYAGYEPIYSAFLGAYVSIEDEHERRYLGFWRRGTDGLVVRIHPQTLP